MKQDCRNEGTSALKLSVLNASNQVIQQKSISYPDLPGGFEVDLDATIDTLPAGTYTYLILTPGHWRAASGQISVSSEKIQSILNVQ